jgi:hypothetical protein
VEELKKGRGGIHPGLVCIQVEYDVTETKGNRKTYHVKRPQWVLPGTALRQVAEGGPEGKVVKINLDKMKEKGIKFPTPEDLDRFHTHDGVAEPHLVSLKHPDEKTRAASEKELEDYWHLFTHSDPDKLHQRLHAHKPFHNIHHSQKPHKTDEEMAEHRDEKQKFESKIHGKGNESSSWLNNPKLNVKTVKLNFKGQSIEGQRYSKDKFEAYIFEYHDAAFVYTEKDGYKIFNGRRPLTEALTYLETVFAPKLKKSLDELKQDIITKIQTLDKSISDPDAMINRSMVLNKFKNGDDEIVLAGLNGEYSVTVNKTPIINTTDFTKAIAKYYSLIAGAVQAKESDKDMALEIFGEKLLQLNRSIRPMINKLGDTKAAMFLLDFDYSEIDWPFNDQWLTITKAEQPRSMQIGNVPPNEELGYPANDYGDKPSKKGDNTLSPQDKARQNQRPIEEKETRDIAPVSTMR